MCPQKASGWSPSGRPKLLCEQWLKATEWPEGEMGPRSPGVTDFREPNALPGGEDLGGGPRRPREGATGQKCPGALSLLSSPVVSRPPSHSPSRSRPRGFPHRCAFRLCWFNLEEALPLSQNTEIPLHGCGVRYWEQLAPPVGGP